MLASVELVGLKDNQIMAPWSSQAMKNGDDDEPMDCWIYQIANDDDSHLSELIITPFPREVWPDIWSLSVSVKETPGILSRISNILADHSINILKSRSATAHHSNAHSLRFVLDCERYNSPVDGRNDDRMNSSDASLRDLEHRLYIELNEDVLFFGRDRPSLHIERNNSLWLQSKRLKKRGHHIDRAEVLKAKGGVLEIPYTFLMPIKDKYTKKYRLPDDLPDYPLALLSHRDFFLNAFVFFEGIGIIQCIASIENKPRAIARLTGLFTDAGFNILATKAWTSGNQGKTSAWFLLRKLEFNGYDKESGKTIFNEIMSMLGNEEHREWVREFAPNIQHQDLPTGV
jgi:uncharacterized protein with ACT and thioredoxin-like domain